MVVPPQQPALKPLHSGASLNPSKLAKIDWLSTEELTHSLVPGLEHCLKTRPDGIHILRQRGIDVDRLPRDVVVKE
jgi:hypothetical protein